MRLYHNPRCSKSRQAVALLTERGIEFEDYRYLDHGIAEEDLTIIAPLEGVIRKRDIGDLGTLDLTNSADVKEKTSASRGRLQSPCRQGAKTTYIFYFPRGNDRNPKRGFHRKP